MDKVLKNSDVAKVELEIPEGHRHIRTTITLVDGESWILQEATVAAIVRGYIDIKTHPQREKVTLEATREGARKEGYATCQLLEKG